MQNKKKKLISSLLALIMLLGLIAAVQTAAGAADIQAGIPTFKLGTTDGVASPTIVGFAGKQWAVIGYNGAGVASPSGTLTLLLANGQSYGNSRFHPKFDNQYSGSDLKTAMDNAYNGISNAKEKYLIKARDLAGGSTNEGATGYNIDNIAGPAVSGARFWPLSWAEAGKVNGEVRKFTLWWWLRSPGEGGDLVVIDYGDGDVFSYGVVSQSGIAVRPAFNLNLTSVIFTSAAAGGKSGNVGANLSSAAAPSATDAVKFTAKDSTLKLVCTDAAARTVKVGDTVNVEYSGATAGDSNYISCVIVDGTNRVLYYGKLAKTTAGMTGGTASFTVPTLPTGNYAIKLFSEEANGDNYTDFCSEPINIQMTVTASDPLSITKDPVSVTVAEGAAATFTVTATGISPLTYMWQRSMNNGISWSDFTTKAGLDAGAETPTLALTKVNASSNAHQFRCVVTDPLGQSVTSQAATLTVLPANAASVAPTTVDYIINSNTDITVTLNKGAYSLQYILYGATELKVGSDYTVSDDKITFKASWLSTLAKGVHTVRIIVTVNATLNPTLDINVTETVFIPVTDITGVPLTATAGTPLTLTGTVAPSGATNKTITWSIKDAGTTGATISGSIFNATAAGTAVVTATIANGETETTPYTQDFNVTVSTAFTAETDTTGLPTIAIVGILLLLVVVVVVLVVVINKKIKRSVKNAGTTNAKIAADTNVLETTTAGAAVITATVEKGLSDTAAFTDDRIGKA